VGVGGFGGGMGGGFGGPQISFNSLLSNTYTSKLPQVFQFRPDATGKITINDVPAYGYMELIATAPGLAVARWSNHRGDHVGDTFDRAIDILMKPESIISGRVITPDTQGLAGVTVRAFRQAESIYFPGTQESAVEYFRAQTDKDGAFSLSGLPAGTYSLSLENLPDQFTQHYGFQVDVYAAAPRIVKLRVIPTIPVSGRVLDSNGKPMAGVTVLIKGISHLVTDAEGLFSTRLPADGKKLSVEAWPPKDPETGIQAPGDSKEITLKPGQAPVTDLNFTLPAKEKPAAPPQPTPSGPASAAPRRPGPSNPAGIQPAVEPASTGAAAPAEKVPATDQYDPAKNLIPETAKKRSRTVKPSAVTARSFEYQVDGLKVGERDYFPSGNLSSERIYKDGKPEGVWYQFHDNGKLFSVQNYKDGKPAGAFRFWDANGKLLGESTITSGNGIMREFTRAGKLHPDFPQYYIAGNKVSKDDYLRAAENDPLLKISLERDRPVEKESLSFNGPVTFKDEDVVAEPPLLPLSGKVTFQGKPLAEGTISFQPVDGPRSSGTNIKNGEFKIPADKGLPPGKYQVQISSPDHSKAKQAGAGRIVPLPERIPEAYNTKSKLTVEITKDGKNDFSFDIK
ncbi:MAG: carboxypeptidase regulatory-like domain-containing protein, partial [Planctomycetota bacterium]|nr:carboxypeptidase regulatory-like domain-containing protein [Planctomycetota bacterium]